MAGPPNPVTPLTNGNHSEPNPSPPPRMGGGDWGLVGTGGPQMVSSLSESPADEEIKQLGLA